MKKKIDYRARIAAMDAIEAAGKDHLEKLAALQDRVIAGKNASDDAETAKNGSDGIWSHVFALAVIVETVTAANGNTDERADLFNDVMGQWTQPGVGPDGKPLKLTTTGQYASTARKALEAVTASGETLAKFDGVGVAEVRASFRSKADVVLLDMVKDATLQLRYIVKHGKAEAKEETIKLLCELIGAEYRPIKAAKDAASNKGKAATALPELQQQPPAEAGTVETAADALADAGNEEEAEPQKQAVGE